MRVEIPAIHGMFMAMNGPAVYESDEDILTSPDSHLCLKMRNPENGMLILMLDIVAMNTTTSYHMDKVEGAVYTAFETRSGLTGTLREIWEEPCESGIFTATDFFGNESFTYQEGLGAGYAYSAIYNECGHYIDGYIHEDFRDELYDVMIDIINSLEVLDHSAK